jgi:uncharacterized protein YjbI with pentapeptide repeats
MSNSKLDLKRKNLRVINISNYNFIGAHLEGANLRRKNLTGKNLAKTKLNDVNLEKANLTRAILTGTTSIRGNFTKANLTDAILEDAFLLKAIFEQADLQRANLERAYLSSAILERADLRGAILIQANLTRANLKGADLRGANLERTNLIGADLKGADLRGANLTEANLTGADLTGADLTGVILSKIQERQMIREPVYNIIDQNLRRDRNNAMAQQPIYIYSIIGDEDDESAQQNRRNIEPVRYNPLSRDSRLARNQSSAQRRHHSGSLFIQIPEKFLKLQNSANGLCPNYNHLYDFILDELDQDLSRGIQFKYIGQPVIDAGGPKRDIFEKLLPIYTHRFFESIESNNGCLILKNDIDMEIFIDETQKIIFLAKAAGTLIFLKIDPRLFHLFSDKEYFNNNKKKQENFQVLYRAVNYYTNTNNNTYNVLSKNTNKTFLRNRKIDKNKNDIIQRYKQEQNEEIRKKLKKEIRLRKFLVEFGFTTWKQFENMLDFYKNIIEKNKQYFSFKLDFDLESFIKKIRIRKVSEGEIPLSIFGELSSDKTTFQFKESPIYGEYEYFHPFLDYILGPESTDKRREMCIAYVTGSSYYPGSFTFVLQSLSDIKPFDAHTCIFECHFFQNHRNRINPFQTKEEFIEFQLKPKSGSNFSIA